MGSSRSRTNWRLTRVNTSRNVLRLIVDYLSPRRETFACRVDLDRCPVRWNCDYAFAGCTGLGFEEVEEVEEDDEDEDEDDDDDEQSALW